MFEYQFRVLAIGAAVMLAAIAQAAAQCCAPVVSSCCAAPAPVVFAPPVAPCCATPAPVVAAPVGFGCCAAPMPEMYVVNQGPVYSGPGAYVTQRNFIEGDQVAPVGYPYVGYVDAGTPYGGFYRGPGIYRGPGVYRGWAGRGYPYRRGYFARPGLRVYGGYGPRRALYRGGPVRMSGVAAARRPIR